METVKLRMGSAVFKKPDGSKISMDVLSDSTKAEALEAINSAKGAALSDITTGKNAAVSAVDAKKSEVTSAIDTAKANAVNGVDAKKTEAIGAIQDVMKTIPEEYSALSESITKIQNEVGSVQKIDEITYVELSTNNNYATFNTQMDAGVEYTISVDMHGFTAEQFRQFRKTVTFYNSKSSTGTDKTVDLPIEENDSPVVIKYTPTKPIKYARLNFASGYTSTTNTSHWVISIETSNIEKNAEAINSNAMRIEEIGNDVGYLNTDIGYNLIPVDVEYTSNARVDFASGGLIINDTYTTSATDFIEIDASKGYVCNWVAVMKRLYDEATDTWSSAFVEPFNRMYMAFYDENKRFVPTTSVNTDVSKAIPANAKYIRVTVNDEQKSFARLIYGQFTTRQSIRQVEYTKMPYTDYITPNSGYENFNMVCFGDSITHGDTGVGDGVSYVEYASDYIHANLMNVGFGGSRMSSTGATGGTQYFSFEKLCEAIVSGDWTNQDAYIASNPTYEGHLQTLKSVDWSKVNAISLLYGANDYASDTPVGTEYSTDKTKYDGACAYGLDLLLTKYPHLQVLIMTPFYRQMTFGNISTGSDVAPNGAGLTMKDYGESLKNVQSIVHCAIADTEKELGINKYNIRYWTMDGTHPRTDQAQKRFGHMFANIIKRYVSPF